MLNHSTAYDAPPIHNPPLDPALAETQTPQHYPPPTHQNSRQIILQQVSLSNWAQRSYRLLNNFCIQVGPSHQHSPSPSPRSQSQIHMDTRSLTSLVAQGWNQAQMKLGTVTGLNIMWLLQLMKRVWVCIRMKMFQWMKINNTDPMHDLQHISNFITNRFRISPPVFADVFNPLLQEQIGTGVEQATPTDELYSPTSPLQIYFSSYDSDEANDSRGLATPHNRQIVLGLQFTSTMFSGKRNRDGLLDRSQSADSVFLFTSTKHQIREKKRKKRYEEWDAKGDFIMWVSPLADDIQAKALTDVSMARDMGVEPTFPTSSADRKKRVVTTSLIDPKGDWNLKRNKTSSPTIQNAATT